MFTISADSGSIRPGIRVYAVGDIHGRLDLLDRLLAQITAYEAARPSPRTLLVFLGDYIDRGPDSRGVIERLLHGLPQGAEARFLRGNHEWMMLRCLAAPGYFPNWGMNGGWETLESYGVSGRLASDTREMVSQLAVELPDAHLDFLQGLETSLTVGDYFFVHAGVRPGVALDQQAEQDLLFIREPFLSHDGAFGKIVVHGHTPVREPEIRENRIGIDTGAVFTGRLTALRLEEDRREFLFAEGEAGRR
jgi:serine/threonine protein phosphatase 1